MVSQLPSKEDRMEKKKEGIKTTEELPSKKIMCNLVMDTINI